MNSGRNDPCHCGSGKKYKKCCLPKDEKDKQGNSMAPAPAEPRSSKSPDGRGASQDPRVQAWNARMDEFEKSDYEGRIVLFSQALEQPELMDGETAFEMLGRLFKQTMERGEHDRFRALVASLRARRPEVYDEEVRFCLKWQIANELITGADDLLTEHVRAMAALAGHNIDLWNRVEDMLAYHGRLSLLLEGMRIAWPEVRESADVVPWGIEEFGQRGRNYEILEYATRTQAPDANDPALLELLKPYGATIASRLSSYLAYFSGLPGRQWSVSDFDLTAHHHADDEEWDDEGDEDDEDLEEPAGSEETQSQAGKEDAPTGEQNLWHLSVEFLGYLHLREGVPASRASIGCRGLLEFIHLRDKGDLEYRESMLQVMQREMALQQGRRLPPMRGFKEYEHALVPDRERLDHFLSRLLDFANGLYHRAAAFFEIIPPWLRFLESRQLIDGNIRARLLGELPGLNDSLVEFFKDYPDDPVLHRAMSGWRENAAREVPTH